MHINFLAEAGQVVSIMLAFIGFFWILKKFAWGPVLGLLDERQKKIQDGFADIRRLQAEAAETLKQYEERIKGIEAEARERIQAAVADGQRVAAEITQKAREEAGQIADQSRKKIEMEMATLRKQMKDEIIKLTLMATERLINEKLNEERDRQLVGSFISDLEKK